MIYFMLKLRYISGDDPENENSKNKRKVKGIWLKKQRKQKIIPESKKKHKRNIKEKVLLKVSVVFLLLVVIGWFTFGAKVMKLRSEAKKLVAQSRRRHLRHHRQVLYMTPTENSY